jgi:hypothetical protein
VEVDASEREHLLDVSARALEERPWRRPGTTGIDENHVRHPAHLKRHIDPASAAVGALHPVGEAALEQTAHEHRAGGIIATEEVSTTDHEHPHAPPHATALHNHAVGF